MADPLLAIARSALLGHSSTHYDTRTIDTDLANLSMLHPTAKRMVIKAFLQSLEKQSREKQQTPSTTIHLAISVVAKPPPPPPPLVVALAPHTSPTPPPPIVVALAPPPPPLPPPPPPSEYWQKPECMTPNDFVTSQYSYPSPAAYLVPPESDEVPLLPTLQFEYDESMAYNTASEGWN